MEIDNMKKLLEVMRTLRGENGCPWDREQSMQSLRPYIIEEAFETVEALDELDKTKPETLAELKKVRLTCSVALWGGRDVANK